MQAGPTCIVCAPVPDVSRAASSTDVPQMPELTKSLELFPAACAAAKSPSGGAIMAVDVDSRLVFDGADWSHAARRRYICRLAVFNRP